MRSWSLDARRPQAYAHSSVATHDVLDLEYHRRMMQFVLLLVLVLVLLSIIAQEGVGGARETAR